jgi:hypothetical protein
MMLGGPVFRVQCAFPNRVTMKSQTLTAGSNIDHMTASHDDVT